MTIETLLWLNLVILIGLPILVFILAAGSRVTAAYGAFVLIAVPSWAGWCVFVAQHFIVKYW